MPRKEKYWYVHKWDHFVIWYWAIILLGITIFLITNSDSNSLKTFFKEDKNTFFHLENILLAFVGCFVGGLSISIVGVIFSYGLIFKSLYELRKDLCPDQINKLADTLKKGSEINNIMRHVFYNILRIIGFGSILLGSYLTIWPWDHTQYVVLKGALLFVLMGIVPAVMSVIFWLLKYPGAPLNILLDLFYSCCKSADIPPLES